MPINKTKRENGYGEKLQVTVVTVDKDKRRVECATRDGAMIFAAIWETETVFRWPEVGEIWTVRKDTGIWRMDAIVQTNLAELESEHIPTTLEELPEGDTRIIGENVHISNLVTSGDAHIGNLITKGVNRSIETVLPTEAELGDTIIYKVENHVYWNLLYTKEATYPWAKIGGRPLYKKIVGALTASNPTFITTGAPSLTIPLAMEADFYYGALYVQLTGATGGQTNFGLLVNGAAISSNILPTIGNFQFMTVPGPHMHDEGVAAKGVTAILDYNAANQTGIIAEPWLAIDPIRIG